VLLLLTVTVSDAVGRGQIKFTGDGRGDFVLVLGGGNLMCRELEMTGKVNQN